MKLLIVTTLFMLTSCSSVRFSSDGKVPVYANTKEVSKVMKRSKKEKLEFYLWGTYPQEHVIQVDKVAEELGFYKGATLYVSQYRDGLDTLKTLFSLGLYSPLTVEVTYIGENYSE